MAWRGGNSKRGKVVIDLPAWEWRKKKELKARNTQEEKGVKSTCWEWDEELDQVHMQHDVHTVGINRDRNKKPKGEL